MITFGFGGCPGLTRMVVAALKWTCSVLILLLFLSFSKSSFWFVSLRHKTGRRGQISWTLGGGVSGNICPLKPSISGNRILTIKNTMTLNKSLNPEIIVLYNKGLFMRKVVLKYRDFPGRMKTTRVWRSARVQDPCSKPAAASFWSDQQRRRGQQSLSRCTDASSWSGSGRGRIFCGIYWIMNILIKILAAKEQL